MLTITMAIIIYIIASHNNSGVVSKNQQRATLAASSKMTKLFQIHQ